MIRWTWLISPGFGTVWRWCALLVCNHRALLLSITNNSFPLPFIQLILFGLHAKVPSPIRSLQHLCRSHKYQNFSRKNRAPFPQTALLYRWRKRHQPHQLHFLIETNWTMNNLWNLDRFAKRPKHYNPPKRI